MVREKDINLCNILCSFNSYSSIISITQQQSKALPLSNNTQPTTHPQQPSRLFEASTFNMVTATTHPVRASGASAKLFPLAIVAGTGKSSSVSKLPSLTDFSSVTIVVGYVSSQLSNSRNIMDSRFAQYNSPQSEAQRAKTFEGTNLDPRKSMFNILGH